MCEQRWNHAIGTAILLATIVFIAVAMSGCGSNRVFVKDCVKAENVDLWDCEML